MLTTKKILADRIGISPDSLPFYPDGKVPNSSGSDSGTSGSISSVSPSVTYQAPIVETHSNMTSDEIDEINSSQKVYVVESDITDTQNRVRVAESESTF